MERLDHAVYDKMQIDKKYYSLPARDFFKTDFYYQSFIYSPTDEPVSCLKNNIKIYIKICIKTAPTCFGVTVTPSSGSA